MISLYDGKLRLRTHKIRVEGVTFTLLAGHYDTHCSGGGGGARTGTQAWAGTGAEARSGTGTKPGAGTRAGSEAWAGTGADDRTGAGVLGPTIVAGPGTCTDDGAVVMVTLGYDACLSATGDWMVLEIVLLLLMRMVFGMVTMLMMSW